MKYVIVITMFLAACQASPGTPPTDTPQTRIGDAFYRTVDVSNIPVDHPEVEDSETEIREVIILEPEVMPSEINYPPGPYAIEKFKVLPNMSFYDPWAQEWFDLSELYKHEQHKALLLVSSAGWCGPCLGEAAALIHIYEKYNHDGLEIVYTMGNTNFPGDTPFDDNHEDPDSASYSSDLTFMLDWVIMIENLAEKSINYKIYADPNREILKHFPNHAWPLSMLVTTKDMGVRLVEEGYWSVLIENKISLVLFNDVPSIPFE